MKTIIEGAQHDDLAAMVAILAEDELGGHGDVLTPATEPAYRRALEAILTDSSAQLLVGRGEDGVVLGLAHATACWSLSDQGARMVTLHALFIAKAARGRQLGAQLLSHIEDWAQAQNARFVTLVSNKKREDAHRFYRSHGYEQRHQGFKKELG
jgi:GNAT superfamily N-acetyltransferase